MAKLRFTGANGSMGLIRNQVYDVDVYSDNGYIWVKWNDRKCPYISIETFKNNWAPVDTTCQKAEEAISIMKKAFDIYHTNAHKNIDKDSDMYWYWSGIAEGTRRSWELIEELFNIKEEI